MIRLALVVIVPFFTFACGGRSPGADAGGTGQTNTPPIGTGVTWYRDVLPLVQNHCQSCHVAGGIAPFALDTYESAAAIHSTIAGAVASRQMPPWLPDDSCVELKGSRRLSDADVDVFVRWSSAGAPAGDPADAPAPPDAAPGLPRFDAVLEPSNTYVPNASKADDYHCFVLPPAFDTQKDLIGFAVDPGTPSQVHHVILFSIPQSIAQNLDANEAGPGWTCYGGPGVSRAQQAQVTMLGGWVPGTGATQYPDGTGINVPAGDVVVMQVHYNMSHGAPVADRTQVKLEFASKPVLSALIIP
ncbi:MAG TPA: hypothetical protein VE782_03620, partial [Myxococcaceae bacterium]|nr:hypothetical protein [Myxococcaceae bacterium]